MQQVRQRETGRGHSSDHPALRTALPRCGGRGLADLGVLRRTCLAHDGAHRPQGLRHRHALREGCLRCLAAPLAAAVSR
jgi:hypothetical protein